MENEQETKDERCGVAQVADVRKVEIDAISTRINQNLDSVVNSFGEPVRLDISDAEIVPTEGKKLDFSQFINFQGLVADALTNVSLKANRKNPLGEWYEVANKKLGFVYFRDFDGIIEETYAYFALPVKETDGERLWLVTRVAKHYGDTNDKITAKSFAAKKLITAIKGIARAGQLTEAMCKKLHVEVYDHTKLVELKKSGMKNNLKRYDVILAASKSLNNRGLVSLVQELNGILIARRENAEKNSKKQSPQTGVRDVPEMGTPPANVLH